MITASIATLPARVELFTRVVEAVLPSVDRLNVFLDGHTEIPTCLRSPKIVVAHATEHGRLHGSGKFLWAGDQATKGYHLTIDDDLNYPPDYVETLIDAVDRYARQALVCVFGRRFLTPKPTDIRRGPLLSYPATAVLAQDIHVHVPGTGTAAWHTDGFRISPAAQPFQDDMHMALTARAQQVPVVAVARKAQWVTDQPYTGFKTAEMPEKTSTFNRLLAENGPWPALPVPTDYTANVIRRYWR